MQHVVNKPWGYEPCTVHPAYVQPTDDVDPTVSHVALQAHAHCIEPFYHVEPDMQHVVRQHWDYEPCLQPAYGGHDSTMSAISQQPGTTCPASFQPEFVPRSPHDLPGAAAVCTIPNPVQPQAECETGTQLVPEMPATHHHDQQSCKQAVAVVPPESETLPVPLAVVKLDIGATLTAEISNADGEAEWNWGRAMDFVGAKTKKDHVSLKRNMPYFQAEFDAFSF